MAAFDYPARPHARKHSPTGYARYGSYRPWLRDEFTFRCVYCLKREQWGIVRGTFDIDHFLPQARDPDAKNHYDNLLYACATCNAAKGNRSVPDPIEVLHAHDVRVRADGSIEALSREARRLVFVLGLDDAEYREFRMLWTGIVGLAEQQAPALHARLMGFPDDLPDLKRLRPPAGNQRPEGVEESWFAERDTHRFISDFLMGGKRRWCFSCSGRGEPSLNGRRHTTSTDRASLPSFQGRRRAVEVFRS